MFKFILGFLSLLSLFPQTNCLAQIEKPIDKSEQQEQDIEIWDPLEPVNRGIFWFNDKLDTALFEPLAKGYDYITPEPVQSGVKNFFRNLNYPIFLLSDLTQLKFDQAASDSGRFLINSTIGLLGLFDVASNFGLEYHPEDLGTALAYYGVPSGPYLVLPLLGPTNLRDFTGSIVDSLVSPTAVISYTGLKDEEKLWLIGGINSLNLINTRSNMIENIDSAKEASLDYYLFTQSAYEQYRQGVIEDKSFDFKGPSEDEAMENEEFGEE
jgi:phospholipid-binding lipoprotein MlaA